MTPEERAEKIVALTRNCAVSDDAELLVLIKTQISEAVREAHDNAVKESLKVSSCDDCLSKGFAMAREQAAGIIKEFDDEADGMYELAKRIQAMEP